MLSHARAVPVLKRDFLFFRTTHASVLRALGAVFDRRAHTIQETHTVPGHISHGRRDGSAPHSFVPTFFFPLHPFVTVQRLRCPDRTPLIAPSCSLPFGLQRILLSHKTHDTVSDFPLLPPPRRICPRLNPMYYKTLIFSSFLPSYHPFISPLDRGNVRENPVVDTGRGQGGPSRKRAISGVAA